MRHYLSAIIGTVVCFALYSTPLCAQTAGKTVRIVASCADSPHMLANRPSIVFTPDSVTENLLIELYPEFRYQRIIGFGGAFTETAAYNFSLPDARTRQKIIDRLFDKNGLNLNFCRTHINSADFGLEEYSYVAERDSTLSTFSIAREQKQIIPMIQAARKANPELLLLASPWSPPAWMKDNDSLIHGGHLLPRYRQLWADYFARYLAEYHKEGLDFFAVTVQNEPKAVQTWESCIWSGAQEGEFAVDYLRPTLDKAGFGATKIMIWDHNKERVMERARETFAVPGAEQAIWGIAHHWYSGDHFDNLRMTHELFPDKPLIATENSVGRALTDSAAWATVERYAKEAIMDFNNFTSAIVVWNLLVDAHTGGPFHNRPDGTGAPIYVDAQSRAFTVGPLYYAIGHFSKFIDRGAVRIGSSSYDDAIKVAAFSNPDGSIVAVVLNTTPTAATPKIRLDNCTAEFTLPAHSLQTLIIQN